MTETFPFRGADGRTVRFSFEEDEYDLPPTASELDGAEGRVIESAQKDTGIVTIDVAKIEIDGDQYVVSENDGESVMLYYEGREVFIPNEAVVVGET